MSRHFGAFESRFSVIAFVAGCVREREIDDGSRRRETINFDRESRWISTERDAESRWRETLNLDGERC
ncbi:hypothetical protein Bca4012_037291 [Brassica carinata]